MEMLNGNVGIRLKHFYMTKKLKHSCTHVRLKGTVNSLRAAPYLNVHLKEQTMVQKWIRNTLPQ